MSYYFKDKLSIKSNQLLSNILAELILLTQDVQTYRQLLANTPYFDCIQLFRVLDRDKKGFLCLKDFQYLVGISDKKLVAYAFSYFDQSKLGQISRLQFSSFLLSRRNIELRQLVSERIQTPELQFYPNHVIGEQLELFTNLIQAIINQQMKIICLRKKLLNSSDYSIIGVLSSLDVNDHKWVSLSDVHKFMQNYGISTPIDQVQNIVQIMDSQLSGKITIDQLKWIIQGFQGKDKDYLKKLKSANKKYQSLRTSRNSNLNKQSRETKNFQSQRKLKQINPPNIVIQNQQNFEKNYPKSQKKQIFEQNNQNYSSTKDFYTILKRFKQVQAYSNEIDEKLIKQEMILRSEALKQYDKKVLQKSIKQNQKYIQELKAKRNLQDIKNKYSYQLPNKYERLSYLSKYNNAKDEIPYIQKQKNYKYTISDKISNIDKKPINEQIKNNSIDKPNIDNLYQKAQEKNNVHLTQKQKKEIDQKIQSYKNSRNTNQINQIDKKDSIYSFSNSRNDYGTSSRYEKLFLNQDYKYNNDNGSCHQKLGQNDSYKKKLTFFEQPYKNRYDSRVNSISDYNLQTKKSHFFEDRIPQYQRSGLQSNKKSIIQNFESPSRRINELNTNYNKYGETTQTKLGVTQQKKSIY